jgi:Flp pilus assembly protein TadD
MDRLVHRGDGQSDAAVAAATFDVSPADPPAAKVPSLADTDAVPVEPVPKTVSPPTLESEDGALKVALAALAGSESVEAHRRAAAEYRRAHVFDAAERHLTKALALSPGNATVLEERARLWRDAGVLDRALSDAHRAVYVAPSSAGAQNTLGTILYALGRVGEARRRFATAVALDAGAAYARSNLCFAARADGDLVGALAACDEALRIAPDFAPARENRALVAASLGRAGS